MAVELEDMHDAFPNGLAVECLFYGHRLDKRSRAAVLRFDGVLQLAYLDLGHELTL
jgi:hypothetical protein